MRDPIVLDGSTLTLADLLSASGGAPVELDPAAVARAASSHEALAGLDGERAVYGRTTGVGAARDEVAPAPVAHGLQLLRSHAAGWGEPLPGPVVRAALAVRANQLLAGGSGADPALPAALADLVSSADGDLPVVHRYGSLGTGDLTALAEVGLTLLGERPRADRSVRADSRLTPADALPLMSSNAFSIAENGLLTIGLQGLAAAADIIASLSFVALQGNPEAFSETASAATPFPGAMHVMSTVRGLVMDQPELPAHVQDFFGLRTWPQVHGPLHDALSQLAAVVEAMANAASENPLVQATEGGVGVTHHGGFHAAYLVLGVDSVLLAMTRSAQAVQSRISHLLTDGSTGLPRFLSDVTSGSSGLLITEYVAASALATVRGTASAPSSVQTAAASAAIEDDASFAGHAAVRLRDATTAYRRMLAVELLCTVRALRVRGFTLIGELGAALQRCATLPEGLRDRDISAELELAETVVESYAASAVAVRDPHGVRAS